MKKVVVLFIGLLIIGAMVSAQDATKKSAKIPTVDGAVQAGEYQFQKSDSGLDFSATIGTDGNAYLAVSASTTGWVAIGTGSQRMDGSRMFMASVTSGKAAFSEEIGQGHRHATASDSIAKKGMVKQADGKTTLEIALPLDKVATNGVIDIILAYGKSPGLTTMHAAYTRLSLKVE